LLGIGVIAALVVGWQVVAFAASLPGSDFEIDDNANLINDANNPLPDDWATIDQSPPGPDQTADGFEVRKMDEPTGRGDNSFGEGTKEDDAVPTVVSGRIPNNKSDLLNFGVYLETTDTGEQFLNLFWHRVQEPTGTTNMDFEFNQSSTLSSNGTTPVRTGGDLLIQYDLAQGGTTPQLFLSKWLTQEYVDDQNAAQDPDPYTGNPAEDCEASNSYPCWSTKVDLTAQGDATGSINTTTILAANSDGLGNISPRTFGEAQIDFDAIVGGSGDNCVSFGSAYLKSRSSDSFTSAIKDFIAPATLNLNNCATVIIRKETIPDGATETFRFDHNLLTDPALVDDPGDPPVVTPGIDESTQFDLQDGGVFQNDDVLQGTGYEVSEDLVNIPAGWALTNIDCSASDLDGEGAEPTIEEDATTGELTGAVTFDIDSNADVVDCTYTNTLQQGALRIEKQSTKTGNPLVSNDGAVFSYDDGTTTPVPEVTDNGTGDEDPDVGEVCVSGLLPDDYTVNEESPPAGYGGAPATEADQVLTVVADTDCTADNPPAAAATATFTNPPLADIQVRFRDGGSGETQLTPGETITCDNPTGTDDVTDTTGWDDTLQVNGIEAGATEVTVTCTIPIDP
jgi:hypothetical protein